MHNTIPRNHLNSDCVRGPNVGNEDAADEFQALLWLNVGRVEGIDVGTDVCWLVVEIVIVIVLKITWLGG